GSAPEAEVAGSAARRDWQHPPVVEGRSWAPRAEVKPRRGRVTATALMRRRAVHECRVSRAAPRLMAAPLALEVTAKARAPRRTGWPQAAPPGAAAPRAPAARQAAAAPAGAG